MDDTTQPPGTGTPMLPMGGMPLKEVVDTPRFRKLDRSEAYYRGKQYDGMKYDWNGNYQSYGGEADIRPGWYVPLARRKPNVRMELPKTIVRRFTSFLFGRERFPEIKVEGDEDAEDYARELVNLSRLQSKMIEARNLGGSMGTACLSMAYRGGRPRIQCHNPKNVTVLAWADPDEMIVGSAIEVYRYQRQVYEDQKLRAKPYYYARLWTSNVEVLWSPIPAEVGDKPGWASLVPSETTTHGFGFCPLYWIQNWPDSYSSDGESDYEGLEDDCDAINRLMSAAHKGTVANVDPTLVIKMDPSMNEGHVEKGSGKTIFSPQGADYLELQGNAVEAAKTQIMEERRAVLEAADCVVPDPSEDAGVVTGAALRLRYAPMLARCDIYREQYGKPMARVVSDMLKAARIILEAPSQLISIDGMEPVEFRQELRIPPRIRDGKRTERNPGTAEEVELNWGPYFQNSWEDNEKAIGTAKSASGGKAVASHRTAVQMVQSITGVEDIDAEMDAIEEAAEVVEEAVAEEAGEE